MKTTAQRQPIIVYVYCQYCRHAQTHTQDHLSVSSVATWLTLVHSLYCCIPSLTFIHTHTHIHLPRLLSMSIFCVIIQHYFWLAGYYYYYVVSFLWCIPLDWYVYLASHPPPSPPLLARHCTMLNAAAPTKGFNESIVCRIQCLSKFYFYRMYSFHLSKSSKFSKLYPVVVLYLETLATFLATSSLWII